MIELRAITPIFAGHAGRQQRNIEPNRTQQPGKRTIKFVAEAAAPSLHNLSDECVFVAHDGSAESNVEILKRNTQQVRPMQIPQHLRRGRKGSGVRDALEIGGSIQHGGLPSFARPDSRARLSHELIRYTGSSSCIHPVSGFGSAVKSRTNFSSTMRLLGGLERNARSVFATSRIARVNSLFDL